MPTGEIGAPPPANGLAPLDQGNGAGEQGLDAPRTFPLVRSSTPTVVGLILGLPLIVLATAYLSARSRFAVPAGALLFGAACAAIVLVTRRLDVTEVTLDWRGVFVRRRQLWRFIGYHDIHFVRHALPDARSGVYRVTLVLTKGAVVELPTHREDRRESAGSDQEYTSDRDPVGASLAVEIQERRSRYLRRAT